MKYRPLALIPLLLLSCVKAERNHLDPNSSNSGLAQLSYILYSPTVRFEGAYSCGTNVISIGLYTQCIPNTSVSGEIIKFDYPNGNTLPLTQYNFIAPGTYYVGFNDLICSSWLYCHGPLAFESGKSYTVIMDSGGTMTVTSP